MVYGRVSESDPLFGILDSISEKGGVWRFEDFIAVPREFLAEAGLPTPEDVVPSPRELGAIIGRGLPHMDMLEYPPTKDILEIPARMFAEMSPFGHGPMGMKRSLGSGNPMKMLTAPIDAVAKAADNVVG